MFGGSVGVGSCINTTIHRILMDICGKIDDIVWSDSLDVWGETFATIVCKSISDVVLVNVVMKWILSKNAEYSKLFSKVLDISNGLDDKEALSKLLIHYQRLASRYKIAYDCCKVMEYCF